MLRSVVDSGKHKEMSWDPKSKLQVKRMLFGDLSVLRVFFTPPTAHHSLCLCVSSFLLSLSLSPLFTWIWFVVNFPCRLRSPFTNSGSPGLRLNNARGVQAVQDLGLAFACIREGDPPRDRIYLITACLGLRCTHPHTPCWTSGGVHH